MSQGVTGTHRNAVTTENAPALRDFLRKPFLAEHKGSGRTNSYANAVSLT
jgi:hypothetical protein